jgi:general secretion pathway protein D
MPVMPNMPQTLQPGAAQPGSQPASPTPPNAQPTQPQGAVPQAGVQQTPNSPTTPAEQAPSAPVVESAPQGAFLRFDPPAISQAAGSTASVNVEMQSQTPVSSVSMQLHYDPKLLQIVNVGNAGFLAHDGQPATVVHRDDGNGNLQISAIRPPSAPGVTGKGALFTLVFTLKAAGTTALAPVSLVAKDAKDVPIQATLAGQATVQIQPPAAH